MAKQIGRFLGGPSELAPSYEYDFDQVYFRGTPNDWGTTPVELVDDYTWETTQEFAERFIPVLTLLEGINRILIYVKKNITENIQYRLCKTFIVKYPYDAPDDFGILGI